MAAATSSSTSIPDIERQIARKKDELQALQVELNVAKRLEYGKEFAEYIGKVYAADKANCSHDSSEGIWHNLLRVERPTRVYQNAKDGETIPVFAVTIIRSAEWSQSIETKELILTEIKKLPIPYMYGGGDNYDPAAHFQEVYNNIIARWHLKRDL